MPGNILLKSASGCVIVKLGDFGLSKFIDTDDLTETWAATLALFKHCEYEAKCSTHGFLVHLEVLQQLVPYPDELRSYESRRSRRSYQLVIHQLGSFGTGTQMTRLYITWTSMSTPLVWRSQPCCNQQFPVHLISIRSTIMNVKIFVWSSIGAKLGSLNTRFFLPAKCEAGWTSIVLWHDWK